MDDPTDHCDLVLKGGITSGVVYPLAVVELARRYRFRNIGGTSAGAIAAVVTAAAEYGRAAGGFDKVAALPGELAVSMLDLFQPRPAFRPMFKVLMAGLSGRKAALVAALLAAHWGKALAFGVPGLALMGLAFWLLNWALLGLGVTFAASGALLGAVLALIGQVRRDLPPQDYGLCSGLSPADSARPALTNWLCRTIDTAAGLAPGAGPLTIRHLTGAGINVQTVTTDITTHRPYALPMKNNQHAFCAAEFRRVFPKAIVDHMIAHSSPVKPDWQSPLPDLYYFRSDDLPVVVLARMSLSFPFLIAAVPLYRRDFTLITPEGAPTVRRCLFSDGGISSNFPVHFFDQVLPQAPTFGIALGSFDTARVPAETPDLRVTLPSEMSRGRHLPTRPFTGVLGFVWALFDSAKDWQDAMQSILPGYRERIVTVALKDDSEGGLNLAMQTPVITQLSGYGAEAGRLILTQFSGDEHRWRRYLVELEAVTQILTRFALSWDMATTDGLPYPALAVDYAPQSFAGLSGPDRALLAARATAIASLGRDLAQNPLREDLALSLPRPESRLRLVANMGD